MQIYFFDSSAVVKRYVGETGSKWIINLMRPAAASNIYLANITSVEVISAVARRTRSGSIDSNQEAKATRRFLRDVASRFNILRINDVVISSAVNLAQRHGLRGYDAVQLATALELHNRLLSSGSLPFIFVSADNELNAAAIAEGLTVDNPNNHP